MPVDRFSGHAQTPSGPASAIIDVIPSDTSDLAQMVNGLNVATPGIVRVTTAEGSVGDVFVAAGTAFPLRVARVWSSGTTATGIRGLI